MNDFPIVDPHHHLWDLEHFSYPWLSARPLPASVAGDVAPIAKSYLLDDYLADTANQNVVKSVHVDAGFDPSQPVEETRWLQSIADQARISAWRRGPGRAASARCRNDACRSLPVSERARHPPHRELASRSGEDLCDEAGFPHRPRMAARLRPAETLQSLIRSATLSLADGGRSSARRGARRHHDHPQSCWHAGRPRRRGPVALASGHARPRCAAECLGRRFQGSAWWTGAGRKRASGHSCWTRSKFSGRTGACSPAISRSTSSTAASMRSMAPSRGS